MKSAFVLPARGECLLLASAMFEVFFILLILSVSAVSYTYVIFPWLLGMWSKGRKLSPGDPGHRPGVSILISAYNEEKVIAEKIDSICRSDYPSELIEILVGSDASDDGTVQILNRLAATNPSLKVFDFSERRGKPAVLNELTALARFPVLVFTDANVFFEPQTLSKMLRHFADEKVGLVGANILNVGMKRDGISIQESSYIERENMIKYREGLLWGTMMGPFGGCFALRKALYEPVPQNFLVDDFFISMTALSKGYKSINDLEAVCYEDVSNDMEQEFRRKSRISAGNFQNMSRFRAFISRPFSPAGFCFISHKVMRWLTPFFILLSVLSLVVLSFHHDIFLYLLIAELLLIVSPVIDHVLRLAGIHLKLLRFVSYFSYMNFALMRGFFRFLGGVKAGVWTPTKRGD